MTVQITMKTMYIDVGECYLGFEQVELFFQKLEREAEKLPQK